MAADLGAVGRDGPGQEGTLLGGVGSALSASALSASPLSASALSASALSASALSAYGGPAIAELAGPIGAPVAEVGLPASRRPRLRPVATRSAGRWRRPYVAALVVADAIVLAGSGLLAEFVRFGTANAADTHVVGTSIAYPLLSALLAPLWILTLLASGVYDSRTLGAGTEEYRRILDASVRFVGAMAVLAFLSHVNVSREFVGLVGPLALAVTFFAHWGARRWLHAERARGKCVQRAVLIGSASHVEELVRHLRRAPHGGLSVVGACTGAPSGAQVDVDGEPVPVVTQRDEIIQWVLAGEADAVVVADGAVLGLGAIRRLAARLERTGVDLIVAPGVTGVAGPRIGIRPVGGLPLLHVEEPRFGGPDRVAKHVIERLTASVLLVLLAPVLALVALAVKLSSPGPVLFRQCRVGRAGRPFVMWKFRTMAAGADAELATIRHLNEHDGPLFKIRRDPRVTPVGRWLRRFSLDELPQLWHVVSGHMSMVGPRPPLPGEVESYDDDTRRRLLVRPGLTGLWQVSGRCELAWLDAVRLDLYYVENWSLGLDFVILAKTMAAVVRGRGAY